MFAYLCLFCGLNYRTPQRMHSCTVCGQKTTTGWLREVESPDLTTQQPKPLPSSRSGHSAPSSAA